MEESEKLARLRCDLERQLREEKRQQMLIVFFALIALFISLYNKQYPTCDC